MARPQKQTVDYFPHIAHSEESDTLTVLENKYGNDGYTFWFKLLERLALSDGHYIDCRNEAKWQVLLARLGANEVSGKEMMFLLVEMGAIDKTLWESRIIWCDNFVKNIAHVYKNRKQPLPLKPVITSINPVSTPDNTVSTSSLSVETPHSIVEYSIVDNNNNKEIIKEKPKAKTYGKFENVFLSDKEYDKLKVLFNGSLPDRIEELSEGMASKGYKYKSHYATILLWERKRKKEQQAKLNALGQDHSDPDKYIKGKYGHMVVR